MKLIKGAVANKFQLDKKTSGVNFFEISVSPQPKKNPPSLNLKNGKTQQICW